MDLRYCFSAPAMLRLNKSSFEDENPAQFEMVRDMTTQGIERLRADIANKVPGVTFNMDLLFNAYTEKDMGERFVKFNNFGFDKLYADSGGLQIVTAGKTVDDSLKAAIYKTQSVSDFAMCFDEIPVRNIDGLLVDTKSNRSTTGNKNFLPDLKRASAIKTANNIREQIEVLDGLGTKTKVHYIIQGNTHADMLEWFQDGTTVLDSTHFKKVGGLALADTCMGNGPLESIEMLVAYHNINKQFGRDMIKSHVHMLGLGSVRRLLPILYLMKSGFLPSDLTVSFDSTTFSMSYFMGRFLKADGTKVEGKKAGPAADAAYRQMFHEVWGYFGDLYHGHLPECDEVEFVNHVVKEIRSLADSINNSKDDIFNPIVRSNITLTDCWQVLGFVKHIQLALEHMETSGGSLGALKHVKCMDTYNDWVREHGKKIGSKRIARKGNDLDRFYE